MRVFRKIWQFIKSLFSRKPEPEPQPKKILFGISGHPLNSQEYGANRASVPLGITRKQQTNLLREIGAEIYRMDVSTSASGHVNNNGFVDIINKCDEIECAVLPMVYDRIDYSLSDNENYERGFDQMSGFAKEYGDIVDYVEFGNELRLFDDIGIKGKPGTQADHYVPGTVDSVVAYVKGCYDGIGGRMKTLTPASNGWFPTYLYDRIFEAVPDIDILSWHVYSEMPDGYKKHFGVDNILDYLWDRWKKPIWITETNSRYKEGADNEQRQLDWHLEFYPQCLAHPHTEGYVIHELLNMATKKGAEGNYGIFDFPGLKDGNYQGAINPKKLANYLL